MVERRHAPVLLAEAIEALAPRAGGVYLDCTYGRGGHAGALLERVGQDGRILALDRDPEAVAAGLRVAERDPRLVIERASFTCLGRLLDARGVPKVDGIIFDLGVSSPQLDDPARGFSFQADGPLDMRMSPDTDVSASEWLRDASEADITRALFEYGEERHARRIARAIVRERAVVPVDTTRRLADIVAAASPGRDRHKHPATRTFQAIRIQVNDELGQLHRALEQVPGRLVPGGRLAVISFHSLEDRMVKRFMRAHSRPPVMPRGLPAPPDLAEPPLKVIGKPVRPSAEECGHNPRARSAVLRVAERRA